MTRLMRSALVALVLIFVAFAGAILPWSPELPTAKPAEAATPIWLPYGTRSECTRAYWTGSRYIANIWRNGVPMTVECRRTIYRRPW